jgi:predicted dithiol-disulfide oxidoreductase (DUF899 family)
LPIATVFIRRNGAIRQFLERQLWLVPAEPGGSARHVDFMWSIWAMLERTPEGRDGFGLLSRAIANTNNRTWLWWWKSFPAA